MGFVNMKVILEAGIKGKKCMYVLMAIAILSLIVADILFWRIYSPEVLDRILHPLIALNVISIFWVLLASIIFERTKFIIRDGGIETKGLFKNHFIPFSKIKSIEKKSWFIIIKYQGGIGFTQFAPSNPSQFLEIAIKQKRLADSVRRNKFS